MSIVLSWNKKDSDAILNGYEIYRSTAKATVFQEANRIATIADKAQVQYTDNATAIDTPYWYGVRSKTVYGDVDSTPLLLVETTNPGYGPVAPVVGDYEDGFVASYPNDTLFTLAAHKIMGDQILKNYAESTLNQTLTPTNGGITPNGGYAVNKYWRNGKPMFAPNHALSCFYQGVTINDFYTKVVGPLVAAKPQIEIDGVMYEFRVMTRDEFLRYYACGAAINYAEAANHFTDRIVPKTYFRLGPNVCTSRAMVQNTGDNVLAVQVDGAVTTNHTNTNSFTFPIPIAWYFVPVTN